MLVVGGTLRPLAHRVEHDRPRPWRFVSELERRKHLGSRLVRAGLVERMDLGQRLAGRDRVAALPEADDADRVVDHVVLL